MWIPLGRPQKTPLRGRVVVWYVPFQGEVGHVGPWTAGSGRLALGPRRGEIGANVPTPPGGSGTSRARPLGPVLSGRRGA